MEDKNIWKVILAVGLFMVLAPLAPIVWGLILAFVALLFAVPWLILPVLFAGVGAVTVGYFLVKWLIDLAK